MWVKNVLRIILFIFSVMCICLSMCGHIQVNSVTCGGQKRALDALEVEVQVMVRIMARMLGTKLGSSERAKDIHTAESPLQPSGYFFGAGGF